MKKVTVIVERDKCSPNRCRRECMKYDPLNKAGKEGFHLGSHGKAEIDEELVTEMHRICANKCPFGAIKIVKLPEKLNQNPIHRFGQNLFELYSLPIIKENTIVGIIGRNGIGKSTALQIIAGQIMPNLGNFKTLPSEEEILGKYSTQVLGKYFKKLFEKKLEIAYKPQRVELLGSIYKGKTVQELLEKADERKITKELVKQLDMKAVLNSTIEELSGGELQRLAVIAALAKKADVVYLDEPSSFLDIAHRIKMAKIIREYTKGKSVVIIEHDLATLDYISDEIQIVYGEPAAFGVFSQSKAVRRGINEYLDGYLMDDNVKFRNYAINFKGTSVAREVSPEVLLETEELEKVFDRFHLQVSSMTIKKAEVLAIMGANGLGKSTFLKLLVHEIKPDKGKPPSLKISYKPQYLDHHREETVEEYLRMIAGEEFDSGWYKQNLLEKLGINNILKNKIEYLSGGELQKIHIAACLSDQEADLFALDEPSAFVDVEDRLKVAEIIKEFVTRKEKAALVVDHDIQFVDYLADSLLVFEGIPGREGHVCGPLEKEEGMNRILKNLDITYRKDKQTGRPRINKPDSQLDQEQRAEGKYYYAI